MNPPLCVHLAPAQRAAFGRGIVSGSHRLQDDALFGDDALAELLDRIPRSQLFALHMGSDPERPAENRLALHDGVSGAQLLDAVRLGRLWLNVTRIDRCDLRYRRLIDCLYAGLGVPGFEPDLTQGTLLISSPNALVYYHADGPASVLWHIRGCKRVWVYPALDERYVAREALEDIIAGARHEYLPYAKDLDAGAQVRDLVPGDWMAWPQNAPHRVTNHASLNVSLSTEHFTPQTRRRARLYVANRFFRRRLGWHGPSAREHGAGAAAKIFAHRVARKLGLDPVSPKQHPPATLRVACGAPGGVRALDTAPAATLALST